MKYVRTIRASAGVLLSNFNVFASAASCSMMIQISVSGVFFLDTTRPRSRNDFPMRGQLLERHSRRVAISLRLRRKSEVGSCSMVGGVNAISNLARISGAIFIRLDVSISVVATGVSTAVSNGGRRRHGRNNWTDLLALRLPVIRPLVANLAISHSWPQAVVARASWFAGFSMLLEFTGWSGEWINSQGFLRHIYSMLQIAGKDNKGCGY